MNLKEFRFDRGWKILLYFDVLVPVILFIIALIFPVYKIQTLFSNIFHSYNIYIVKPIPHFASLTGIIGLLYHGSILAYAIKRKNYIDLIICLIISLIIAFIFLLDINYQLIKPLNFS